jgi:C4-dicarboxylate transporter DctM subunit
MFVLVGSIFDRSGVALRLVNFATAIVGRGPGMLPLVAIVVAMFLGGISGSGPANAAAVGAVMIAAMSRAGYPAAFSASVVGAAAATDILIPPSVAFIVYSVLVPGASVPALFAAGMIPGMLAGVALIVPTVLAGAQAQDGRAGVEPAAPAPLEELREATWGLAAPGADPGRHARGLVHAHRGRRGGGVLRPVRRHGDPPHDQVRDLFVILRESGRAVGHHPAGGVAGGHLRLLAVHAGRHRPGHQRHRELQGWANTACCRC